MSDFDKEAEREKLREQLEREEESREATQHMSELLLKGATMTNKHCEDCGDPVFRYQGQEFCPTCGQEIGAAGEAEQVDGSPEAAGSDASAGGTATDEDALRDDGQVDVETGTEAVRAADRRAENASAAPSPATGGGRSPDAPAPQPGSGGDLDEARAALVRKLTSLSRQAEATDDAGRSRDLLEAAREAAEALEAVERARR